MVHYTKQHIALTRRKCTCLTFKALAYCCDFVPQRVLLWHSISVLFVTICYYYLSVNVC